MTARRVVAVVERLDALDDAGQQLADLREHLAAARALLGDVQDLGLGLVEDFLGAAAERVVRGVGDLAGGRRELAQDRALAHDGGVVADVGRRRHVLDQRAEVGEPADVVELLHRGERLGHRHHVGRLAVGDEADDVVVDEPVRFAVEIGVGDHVADAVGGLVVEQQPAQHRLLRLERMRRELQRVELRIVGHGREPSQRPDFTCSPDSAHARGSRPARSRHPVSRAQPGLLVAHLELVEDALDVTLLRDPTRRMQRSVGRSRSSCRARRHSARPGAANCRHLVPATIRKTGNCRGVPLTALVITCAVENSTLANPAARAFAASPARSKP